MPIQGAEPQRVRDLMSTEVKTLGRNDKLSDAESLMSLGRIRHLPVLDEYGHLAGIVLAVCPRRSYLRRLPSTREPEARRGVARRER